MVRLLIATPLYPPEIGGPATFARFAEEELPKRGIAVMVEKFSDVRRFPKLVRYIVYFWRLVRAAGKADTVLALDPLGIGLPAMAAAWVRGTRFFVRVAGDRAWETLRSKVSQEFPISNNQFPNKFQIPNFQISNTPDVEEFQIRRWGFAIELRRLMQGFIARSAEKVIVPSEFLKRVVLAWGVREEKMSVVYSSFEPPQVSETKEEARRALGLSGSIIVSAGRLVPWKGFGALIEIMPQILRDVSDARLVIIGDGPERERLEQQVLLRHLLRSNFGGQEGYGGQAQPAIMFRGRLPQQELHRYIRAADVFVLNSGYEGLSHQLLEAMALGTPIVASDIPGNRELLENGVSGLLVPFNDYGALSKAVVRVLKDMDMARRFARETEERLRTFTAGPAVQRLVLTLTT